MVDDHNRADGDLDDDAVDARPSERPGARRSTWTPPRPAPESGESTSDDDLARALEEDFERLTHSGSISVVAESDASQVEDDASADAEPSVEPPVRRSLPTTELAATLAERAESGEDTVAIMSELEAQLRLQEQDAREFQRWQESVSHSGAPTSSSQVQAVREEFKDLLAIEPPVAHESTKPEPSHIFRRDDVLDTALSSAPAPRTEPVSDIPPPEDHIPAPPPVSPPDSSPIAPPPPSIPDLIEPEAAPRTADSFDFDALIGGATPNTDAEPTVFAAEPEDMAADSIRDADVADTDQAFADLMGPFPVTSEGVAMLPDAQAAPAAPIAGSQAAAETDLHTVSDPVAPAAFRVEDASVEPTALEQRVGRASRLFWLWFAANSSVISVAFGGAVLSLGMSLRQAIVATLIGVAVSFLPLGLGTLAGKWSGQPTMIVSRASFGHVGNILPAILALLVRVFWGAVLLWFLAAGTARILTGADLTGPLTETQVMIIGLAAGFLLALVIAFFGYGLIARIQLVFTIISAILIVGLIVITWPAVDIATALTVGDAPWILVVTGSVLVFSFVGLVWAVSSADLARYQRPSGSGAASMLSSTFGATIPAFVLVGYGAVLAASNPDIASGLIHTPLDTIALLIPVWYPVPLITALAFSLLSGVVVSIYSGGFALQATGASMRRSAGVVIVGAAVAAAAVLIALSIGDFTIVLRDVATSLAVPIAAWAGIFGAEMMIRNKKFDSPSLLKPGGLYPNVRWVNLVMLIIASAVGFGLTTASVGWLNWQGYLFTALEVPFSSDLGGSDVGVFVALFLGLLTPILTGIPGIRRQEELRPAPPGEVHAEA